MDAELPYSLSNVADLPGHEDRAWNVAWNPVKPILASCSADKNVRIYAYTEDLRFKHLDSIPTGHAKTVRSVAWAPSGQTLATASFDANIGVWEKESEVDEAGIDQGEWECISTLEGHETECKSVAYSCNGTYLASCSRDKTVWIWEVLPDAEFETVSVLMEHSQDVKCVAWHPTEEILASASYDDTIKLYIEDPSDDWFCFTTLSGHSSTVWSIAWSPVGGYLASGSDDKTVRIWRRIAEHKWECVLVLTGHDRSVYSVSWGPGKDDKRKGKEGEHLGWLATTGGDGKVMIWEVEEPTVKEGETPSMSKPPDHRLVACLNAAHDVHDVNSVVWCPRKGYEDLLATTGDDGHTKVWKIAPSA
ncbi:WD40 repeat-like protein [Crepidotus variabilis]|uniref:Probable cytosolic iron-sulfur protein assembly protein 1 n=1 Tax=Crepidotus variabilis TaxID=179855 RepID=A0A9P6JJB1_9AGAR|nr:WD40 repeat-like protein [Crepidotus variabilis]